MEHSIWLIIISALGFIFGGGGMVSVVATVLRKADDRRIGAVEKSLSMLGQEKVGKDVCVAQQDRLEEMFRAIRDDISELRVGQNRIWDRMNGKT